MKNYLNKVNLLMIIGFFVSSSDISIGMDGVPQNETNKIKSSIKLGDVENSMNCVQKAFLGDYGSNPILENNNPIGGFHFDGSKVFINLRGSLGLEFLSIFNGDLVPAKEKMGIEGNVHKGLLEAALNIKPQVLSTLWHYRDENRSKFTSESIEIFIGGYSRGSALATILAPIVLLEGKFSFVNCVTYGSLNVFDAIGSRSYRAIIPPENYLSFITEEDILQNYLPNKFPIFKNLFPVANNIIFSAVKSKSYRGRVEKSTYSYLDPMAKMGANFMGITPRIWEAHVPDTYLQAISGIYEERIDWREDSRKRTPDEQPKKVPSPVKQTYNEQHVRNILSLMEDMAYTTEPDAATLLESFPKASVEDVKEAWTRYLGQKVPSPEKQTYNEQNVQDILSLMEDMGYQTEPDAATLLESFSKASVEDVKVAWARYQGKNKK